METQASRLTVTNDCRDGDHFLDELFNLTSKAGGNPIQFRIFDVQLCGSLTKEWLLGELGRVGIGQNQADWMVREDLLRRWSDTNGTEGYLLYTPYQAEVIKQLIENRCYALDEIRHVVSDWNDFLEAVVMEEPRYDDELVPDYEHFVRRAREMLELLSQDNTLDRPSYIPAEQWEAQKADSRSKEMKWKTIVSAVEGKSELEVPIELRETFKRPLFHLRWWDEFLRLNLAKKFETAILQGYSSEVIFRSWSTQGCTVTLSDIDWFSTLRQFRETRRQGKVFPLRVSEFNVTERGVELFTSPTPEVYSELYEKYRLDELAAAMKELGTSVWSPVELPLGDAICPECEARYDRSSPKRVYCSEVCRKRAKSRRWRERDPERARLCQARYWKDYDAS